MPLHFEPPAPRDSARVALLKKELAEAHAAAGRVLARQAAASELLGRLLAPGEAPAAADPGDIHDDENEILDLATVDDDNAHLPHDPFDLGRAEAAAEKLFGIAGAGTVEWSDQQLDVIRRVCLAGTHTVVVAPAGWGKNAIPLLVARAAGASSSSLLHHVVRWQMHR